MPITVQMHELGGPEVLQAVDLPAEPLASGEVRIEHTVIGFNYLDVYLRRGVYGVPLPATLGIEAAGRVVEVGEDVDYIAVGDRVAYAYELGAYAAERRLRARRAIRLPDDVSDEGAAALLFKGLTARMLLRHVHRVGPGDTILVHAAAGGVGLILTSWAKALGAKVVATVGSAAKVPLVEANGADWVAVAGVDDIPALVREATGGQGADAVYDSVGRDTHEASLASLRPFGKLVSYGLASGEVPPIEPRQLSRHGSLFYIRAAIDHYIADDRRYHEAATEVLDLIRAGTIVENVGQRFRLEDIQEAHRQAESRATTGATLILP